MSMKDVARAARRKLRPGRVKTGVKGPGGITGPLAPGFVVDNLYVLDEDNIKPTLTDPPRQPTRDLPLTPSDFVVGVVEEGEARAYPVDSMWIHHLVNDTIESPQLVTFCGRCFSGVSFDPVVDGQRLTFEVEGRYEGNMVIRDVQTGTLWSQMSGEALVGPMVGTRLEMRSTTLSTLGAWIELHPNSESPAWESLVPGDHRVPGELLGGAHLQVSHSDNRLESNAFVLGVDLPTGPVAFPLGGPTERSRVDEVEVGGIPLALIAPAGSWPRPFDRRIDGETIDLKVASDHLEGGGSSWSFDGVATSGPHSGRSLEFVPSRTVHWFAWAAAHPTTTIEAS